MDDQVTNGALTNILCYPYNEDNSLDESDTKTMINDIVTTVDDDTLEEFKFIILSLILKRMSAYAHVLVISLILKLLLIHMMIMLLPILYKYYCTRCCKSWRCLNASGITPIRPEYHLNVTPEESLRP